VKVRRPATDGALGRRVRVRPTAFDPGVVQLSLADQAIVPTVGELAGWIDSLAAGDARAIRTGALFPDAAARFAEAGFAVVDTLALLRIDLTDAPTPTARTVRLRPWRHDDAARVDRAAFGDPWGNAAGDLADIRRATPLHRARARFDGGTLVAFAISGAASGHGYLQRLAVDPEHQRRGHGRALVLDSLDWMTRQRVRNGVVNTSVDNGPALALYEGMGFRRLPEQLVVMQLHLPARP
jgi:ribosomal protein S18 acetylase RimI-like enzyme